MRTPPVSRLAASSLPSGENATTSEPFRLLAPPRSVGGMTVPPLATRQTARFATSAVAVCPSAVVWLLSLAARSAPSGENASDWIASP